MKEVMWGFGFVCKRGKEKGFERRFGVEGWCERGFVVGLGGVESHDGALVFEAHFGLVYAVY
uniref:hypothetical protein n=1 Tax=Neisseria sicca TaxID=490 RepID=UPI001C991163